MFPLPKRCLDALEKMCSAYLWKSVPSSARGAKISWISICTPKKEEGLGLRRLQPWNRVFTLKLNWLLFTKSGSLWVSWVKSILLKGRLFWEVSSQSAGSWLWRRILKERPLPRQFLATIIGADIDTFFWHDDWTSLGPLIAITGSNSPRVSGISRMSTVYKAITNDRWAVPQGRTPICVLLRACLPTIPVLDPLAYDLV